ncbi:MAG: hypothetical protein JEZ09_06260 [Salinivirgaceae bacterium]|nr:hypothetical protein [Salinivirgaceae bacterium]
MDQFRINDNPFLGIRSFETYESNLFFGRKKQIHEALSVLVNTHFLALIGFSGSGKSSLIKAGLIPAILNGNIKNHTNWAITMLKPSDNPISSLALEYTITHNKLATLNGSEIIEIEEAETIFHKSSNPLYEAYQKLTNGAWLIVVDQFEEIFRFKKEHNKNDSLDESQKFVNLFLDGINPKAGDIPIYVIFTMRSDFLDKCTQIPGLIEAINNGHYFLPKMSELSLEDAIVKPIKEKGKGISLDLVKRLLSDLKNRTDQLPIMQHTLMRAWNFWIKNKTEDQLLDVVHYEEIGTISMALSIHAEEVYENLGSNKKRDIAELLFKTLTLLGTNETGLRRPTSFGYIQNLIDCSESDLLDVIDQFRAPEIAFLMPAIYVPIYEDTIIDISHESIMRVWVRLKTWVEEEAKSAELYLRLSKSAELYQQGKATLWINPELEIAVKWQQMNKPNTFWADQYDYGFERAMEFLNYSKTQSDIEISKKETKQKKELNRAKLVVVFLSIASLVSLLLLVISLNLRFESETSEHIALQQANIAKEEIKKAEKQRKDAVALKRIAEQQQEIAEQQKQIIEEHKLYAVEQHHIAKASEKKAKISEARALLSKAVAVKKVEEAKIAEEIAIKKEAEALTAQKKAIESEMNTKRLRLLAIARSMAIESQRVKNKDAELAILLAGQAYKFNSENNGNLHDPDIFNALSIAVDDKPVFRGNNAFRAVDFLNDGKQLISGDDDGKLLLWNIADEKQSISLITDGIYGEIRSIDNYNDKLLSGFENGKVLFWNKINAKTNPTIFAAHSGVIKGIRFITDNLFVSVGADKYIRVWNVQNNLQPVFEKQMNSAVLSIAVSGDMTSFACVDELGEILVFSTAQLNSKSVKINTEKSITSLALNYKGDKLAMGEQSGVIIVRTMGEQSDDYVFSDHKSSITALVFCKKNDFLASSSYDNTIRIWDTSKAKQIPIIISDHESWVMDISFNDRGNILASCSNDKKIILSQVNAQILYSKVCEKSSRNLTKTEWETFVGNDIIYQETCPK